MASEYAYTLYDELGRVSESGVKTENTNDMLFDELLGTDLNGNFLPDRLDYDRFEQWISGDGHRKEVVKTTYTTAFSDPTKFTSTQENLRNRVSAIRYFDSDYTDATPENTTIIPPSTATTYTVMLKPCGSIIPQRTFRDIKV